MRGGWEWCVILKRQSIHVCDALLQLYSLPDGEHNRNLMKGKKANNIQLRLLNTVGRQAAASKRMDVCYSEWSCLRGGGEAWNIKSRPVKSQLLSYNVDNELGMWIDDI